MTKEKRTVQYGGSMTPAEKQMLQMLAKKLDKSMTETILIGLNMLNNSIK